MQRKEPADWVFFNVSIPEKEGEAIAIYQSKIVDIGSIPYIFSNYRGFQDFNAQGNRIGSKNEGLIELGEYSNGLVVFVGNEPNEQNTIWEIENGRLLKKNEQLLDPHWDDH